MDVRLVTTDDERAAAYAVRHDVFVVEQGVPADLELDEQDPDADHFLATLGTDVLGSGRLVVEPPGFADAEPSLGPVGHLGRLAVHARSRGTGLGARLVGAIEQRAADRGLRVVVLGAQTHAVGFYERLGYTAYGDVFDDAGIPHRWMQRRLNPR